MKLNIGLISADPVGVGLPVNASASPPSHSRVNPLPQGRRQALKTQANPGYHPSLADVLAIFPGLVVFNQPGPKLSTLSTLREPVQSGDISVSFSVWRTGTLNDANAGDLRVFKVEAWFLPAT